MRLKSRLSAIIFCLILFSNCQKNDVGKLNCELLTQGLIEKDDEKVVQALGPLLSYYSPEEFEKLTGSLSTFCEIQVISSCFSCYYINPPASNVGLSINVGTNTYQRGLIIGQNAHKRMTVAVQ